MAQLGWSSFTISKRSNRKRSVRLPQDNLLPASLLTFFFFFLQTSASMGIDQCRLSAVVEIVAESYFLMFCFQLKRSNSCSEMFSTTNWWSLFSGSLLREATDELPLALRWSCAQSDGDVSSALVRHPHERINSSYSTFHGIYLMNLGEMLA